MPPAANNTNTGSDTKTYVISAEINGVIEPNQDIEATSANDAKAAALATYADQSSTDRSTGAAAGSSGNQNAPANSRTDVVLHGRRYTPTPTRDTILGWEMDWTVSACSATACSDQTAENKKETVKLFESKNGGPWHWEGVPQPPGGAHDQISPEAKFFNQRWFVGNKQVQMVVGQDSTGNLIKAWEVRVEIKKPGDTPVYTSVQQK